MSRTSKVIAGAIVAFSMFVFTNAALTEEDKAEGNKAIESYLQSDLVKEQDGKFVIEEYRVCQVNMTKEHGGGSTLPIKIKRHIEAPAKGVISRDNLVRMSTEILNGLAISLVGEMIEGITVEQAIQALDCRTSTQPFDNYDYEVNLNMSGEGIQINVLEKSSGESSKDTVNWSEVFGVN